jgi:hypothetical protein
VSVVVAAAAAAGESSVMFAFVAQDVATRLQIPARTATRSTRLVNNKYHNS